ncbi:MAG: ATP-binding protein, partial [Christensenellales bacterium]
MIYCVEDDRSIRELIIYALKSNGFDAIGFGEGGPFFQALENGLPSLILLDIMLPGEDGIEILKRLKASPRTRHIPVIMLTAKSAEYDKVLGLDSGADDYITKPFGIMEFLSRVKAVLRRAGSLNTSSELSAGRLTMNIDRRAVLVDGQEVSLTFKEFELLKYLLKNAGIVLTRDKLLEEVWGYEYEGETRTVDVHIRTLRQKLGEAGSIIETVRGGRVQDRRHSMKKRIYQSMLLLALITILLTSFLITGVIYREFYHDMQQEIRNEALFISTGYNLIGKEVFLSLANQENSSRITWVAGDGTVLFDSVTEAKNMENHRSRPEIADALTSGSGEAVHLSKTLGTQTFYRAVRLNDGTVLRVSATTNSVFRSVLGLLPYIALMAFPVILLTMIIANLLTKKIVFPLNNLDLENPLSNDVYDELSPLLSRMALQNDQIESQIKKLKEKQEEFHAVTENISEGIIVLNQKDLILFLNKSAAGMFNVSPQEVINQHVLTLDRSLAIQKAVETALDGHIFEDTCTIGGDALHLMASPVKDDSGVKGVTLFIMDVTEKQSAEKMRREFTANVSHELKTPLTSILGYAELIHNGMVQPKDMQEFSHRICIEARHLIDLVEDIIRISRLDEKQVQHSFEEVDLLELAEETVGRLSSLAQQKQITLTVRGEHATISGVKQILEEMIYNLCDNAIKYNREKGRVDVSVRTVSENVILTVSDNGFGIPRAHQSRVFERFYRIDKSHSRETGGTGLGLSIVKHGAELHHARVQLSSKPGKGTTMTVTFPR